MFQPASGFRQSLGAAAVRGLASHPFRTAVIDGLDDSSLSRSKLLGAAAALSRHFAPHLPGEAHRRRPACEQRRRGRQSRGRARGQSAGGTEFHERPDAIGRAQEIAGLTTAISAQAFAQRVPDFPWPEKTIQLDELLPR